MYMGGSYHNHKSSERPIRTALEARSIATAVISAKMRQHISIETVSNAGYSSHAASAEFRISNNEGSPENPVNGGFGLTRFLKRLGTIRRHSAKTQRLLGVRLLDLPWLDWSVRLSES